jgi:hypothetical protein
MQAEGTAMVAVVKVVGAKVEQEEEVMERERLAKAAAGAGEKVA